MSSARLIRYARVRRAAAVSAGALALCLCATGTSYADTSLPSPPPVPAPDNVVTTLDQTVTQVTGVDPGLAPSTTSTPPATSPAATEPAPPAPTTGTTRPAAPAPKSATRQVTATKSGPATGAATPGSTVAWEAAPGAGELNLPPATSMATTAGVVPAVAPLLMPRVTQRITPAAATLEADKHSGSPARGILLTLAIAAAVALGYEHGRLARQGMPG